jgi:hypothetical protein
MLRIFSRSRTLAPLLAAFVSLLVSAQAWAQTNGMLRVHVYDETGLDVPGVTLTLTSANLIGGAQVRQSDDLGSAEFTALPPGTYKVVAERANFGTTIVDGISVQINRTTPVEIELKTTTEEVVVKAKQQAVNTESTVRGEVLTKEFLQKIPTGRSYQSAVQNAAGVLAGSGGNPNMAGGATDENTYMLDGANITDPVTGTFSVNFNFDAIQQIEVLLGGYMPEYGVSVGGVVNIVTDSGTNNLEFDTSLYYVNGQLAPKDDERLSADGFEIAPTTFDSKYQQYQTAARISGPVIRDKAWFIISFQNSRSLSALSGIPQAADFNGNYLLAKLTYQPTPEHRFTIFTQTNPTTIDNLEQASPFIKGEAQSRQVQGGVIANGRWQWFLSPDVNLDTTFLAQRTFIEVNGVPCTHDRNRQWNQCKPGVLENTVDFETPGRIGSFGAFSQSAYGFYYFDDRDRYTASSKLQILSVEDPLKGTHDFKFGVEGTQVVWDQVQGYSGNTLFVDLNVSTFDPQTLENYYWQEITGPIKFRTTGSEYNVFAQDSWKPVNNLTLNYGSRVDYFVMRNDLGEPVLGGALLGPRIFGAWDPFGTQKTKIATGFGRFNDTGRLSTASYTSSVGYGSKLYLGEFFGRYLNAADYSYFVSPKTNLNRSYEDLGAPRVDELILTLEREVVEDVALFSSMSGKYTRYGYEPDELNLIYDSDGSTVIGSRFSQNQLSYGRLRTPLLALRNYFQWDLGMRKVESRRWAATATYTFTRSIGSSQTSLTGTFLNDPQTAYNYGLFLTDIRHQVKALAYWDLPTDPWTGTLGAVLVYYDGTPLDRRYYGEFFDDYTVRVFPRGTYVRFNPFWSFSLNYTQAIDVRKGQLSLDFEARNLFNNRAPELPFSSLINQQNRLATAYRQDPLVLQFGVRYDF